MTTVYLDLMEKILSAYSREHILRFFSEVKAEGLTEHGFPRLTANIGILIANGRRRDLLPVFMEMMEYCCKNIPKRKAANDFSVREILCCLAELEQTDAVAKETIAEWKADMATIVPQTCYNVYAAKNDDPVRNWAMFTGVSEFFRQQMGLCDSMEFIEIQIASQLQWLDENDMYKDNAASENHQPLVYDLVTRGLFSLLLYAGYHGRYYDRLVRCLEKSAWLSLKMQSVTGELPFGGRSNGFLHNEAWQTMIFEYAATYYKKSGQLQIASRFKAAANRAIQAVGYWLEQQPISHVKNHFPIASQFGCEEYAYFDKYMITAASFFYAASLHCDPTIPDSGQEEPSEVWQSSANFHKIFARAGGYSLEFDIDADLHYDASGLGRVHQKHAPSALCLSTPCSHKPHYALHLPEAVQLSLCPGVKVGGKWIFATDPIHTYEMLRLEKTDDRAIVELACRFAGGAVVRTVYTVGSDGVFIENTGDEEVGYLLPAFAFDGKVYPEIEAEDSRLTIRYDGWECRYTTNGKITDTGKLAANRNGHYRCFHAEAEKSLWIKVELVPQDGV